MILIIATVIKDFLDHAAITMLPPYFLLTQIKDSTPSDIKLMRTDDTLDFSKNAKKWFNSIWNSGK